MQQTISKTSGAARRRQYKRYLRARDGQRCALCGATDSLTLHHIRPKAIGGDNRAQNLVTVCTSCHQGINRVTLVAAQWLTWGYGVLRLWVARQRRAGR